MSGRGNWVAELKKGDRVIVMYGKHQDSVKYGDIGRVASTTKTQVILESGTRYNRSTGLLVGSIDTLYGRRLVELTSEIKEKRNAGRLHASTLRLVLGVNMGMLSTDQLVRIFDIMEEK